MQVGRSSTRKKPRIRSLNDFVVKFANVNGTGSASANNLFAKALFRMGIPVVAKNIFPSNIQGLPTWYEVRINPHGYLGCRGGVDLMVCVNPQSMTKDLAELNSGGYFLYDSSKPLPPSMQRADVHMIGIPLMDICIREYSDPRQRQLFKNMIYVGALSALLDIEFEVLKTLVSEQFAKREKLIAPNVQALELGFQYATQYYDCPLGIHVRRLDKLGDNIMLDGNAALALGAIYAGATVAAWYPITPSTSVVDAFNRYARRLRIDAGSGRRKYAVVQAEDELSAIGMVIGAGWNGARAFTATSGPGISLMGEFIGLAYFAEVPAVIFNIQRAGPSTGMPTRTQQADILACAYASHGDTRHVLLFPSTPAECFELAALSFDLAEELQTPVFVMSDLDLGMNDHLSPPLSWDDKRHYRRGKVLDTEMLDQMSDRFGRYLDVDGDGICHRTLPGTHPQKGAFFTRGTSRDPYAVYTEDGAAYADNMRRLIRKWGRIQSMVPEPELSFGDGSRPDGLICFGTSAPAVLEAVTGLHRDGMLQLDVLRLMAFPFNLTVKEFIEAHERVFVVEQNRDGQMRSLLLNELHCQPDRLISVLHYDGTPITAKFIAAELQGHLSGAEITPLHPELS